MDRKQYESKEYQLFVSRAILESIGISLDQLKQQITELSCILGPKFIQLIPSSINDFLTLHWVVSLSLRLQKLRHCEGFDKHVARYVGKQVKSNYFVAGIASHLYDKVDNVKLEPITHERRMADILVNYKGEEVYLECKGIETSRFDFKQQHDHMLSILRKYLVDVPHQISITYRRPLSDPELHRLGESLRERAKSVQTNGRLIDNPEILVNVIRRETFTDKRFRTWIGMIEEELDERCRYPGDLYGINGITISIAGPKVSYKRVLREKIRRSKRQYLEDKPFVLMIDANPMLGALAENIRALSSAFQPVTNTRFSAAVLVESNPVLGSTRTDFVFNFVSNPFAKSPIGKEIELLFRTSAD